MLTLRCFLSHSPSSYSPTYFSVPWWVPLMMVLLPSALMAMQVAGLYIVSLRL